MDDLISRQAAIKAIDDLPNCYNGYSDTYDKAYIIGVLEELPPIDAVPVVRCKDCKYKGWSFVKGEMKLVCDNENGLFRDVQMNDFCSAWERSEDA